MKATRTRSREVDDKYLKLVRQFPLVPIRSQEQCDAAAGFIEPLAVKDERELSQGEADYLYALSDLIEAYEQRHLDQTGSDPIDTLKFLMSENDLTASDLGRLLGSRSLGSLILNGKRDLSKAHIRILSERFKVNPGLFISRSA